MKNTFFMGDIMDQRVVEIPLHAPAHQECIMAIAMEFDTTSKRLRTTATGEVTLADLLRHIDNEERAAHLGAPELFDARDATTSLTALEVRRLADVMRSYAKRQAIGPTALVTRNDVVFGMARMYGILSNDFDPRFAVFRNLTDAERWLDVGGEPAA
jgi:hypothetical protein